MTKRMEEHMEELTIKNLAKLDDTFRDQAVRVFVEGFYQPLSNISQDKAKLFEAFRHSFVKDHFYVALLNDKVLGIIAYSTRTGHAQIPDKKTLQKAFGILKGWLVYSMLSQKPIPIEEHQAYIEDVATDPEARGKGVATKLINHVMDTLPYSEYTLEVVNTNTNAIKLYEKLGFEVFKKKKQRFFTKQVGFTEKLYMKKKR